MKSFTKAAEVLNLTQPAVTFQIKNLEEELKTHLFDRDTNKIKLTYTGRILYKHAENILKEYETAKDKIFKVTGKLVGEIRIGIATVLSKYFLPKIIGHFKQINPDIHIQMFVGNSGKLTDELKQHTVDMVVVSEPVSDDRFVVKPFIDDELLVIVSSQHKWAQRQTIDMQELLNEPFVDREHGSGTREMYKKFFNSKGLNLKNFKVIMTMGSVEAVKSYIESGIGYGIVSNIAVEREIRIGLLKYVKIKGESLKRKFLVVYPVQQYNKHLISSFSSFILSKIKTFKGLPPSIYQHFSIKKNMFRNHLLFKICFGE